jgi:hypothetical protein
MDLAQNDDHEFATSRNVKVFVWELLRTPYTCGLISVLCWGRISPHGSGSESVLESCKA